VLRTVLFDHSVPAERRDRASCRAIGCKLSFATLLSATGVEADILEGVHLGTIGFGKV
jgi:hypothetical protein